MYGNQLGVFLFQTERYSLHSTFGEIKTLRLPQKMSGTGSHRGFAFVDFLTKQDAKVSRSIYSVKH